MSPQPRADADRDDQVRRVILIEGAVNALVLVLKLTVGLATHSLAVISDAAHSLTDLANNAVAWFVIRASHAPPDEDHPYGHRKLETLAVFVLAGLLTLIAVELIRHAVVGGPRVTRHEGWALAVLAGVVCVNVGVATWQTRWARRLDSSILRADASHTFADVLTTVVVVAGWQAAARGYPWVDQACAVGVALLVLRLAFGLFRRALPILLDEAALDADAIEAAVIAVEGVRSVNRVRSRSDGTRTAVDLTIRVDPELSISASHEIADRVERTLESAFEVGDVSVHVEPTASAG